MKFDGTSSVVDRAPPGGDHAAAAAAAAAVRGSATPSPTWHHCNHRTNRRNFVG